MNNKTDKLYKLVHRHHGQYPYFLDSAEEAQEMIDLITLLNPSEATQIYIRDITP